MEFIESVSERQAKRKIGCTQQADHNKDNKMHNFKFPCGAILCDKEIFDEVLIVGRMIDADTNEALYLIKRPGGLNYYSAEGMEDNFRVQSVANTLRTSI